MKKSHNCFEMKEIYDKAVMGLFIKSGFSLILRL